MVDCIDKSTQKTGRSLGGSNSPEKTHSAASTGVGWRATQTTLTTVPVAKASGSSQRPAGGRGARARGRASESFSTVGTSIECVCVVLSDICYAVQLPASRLGTYSTDRRYGSYQKNSCRATISCTRIWNLLLCSCWHPTQCDRSNTLRKQFTHTAHSE